MSDDLKRQTYIPFSVDKGLIIAVGGVLVLLLMLLVHLGSDERVFTDAERAPILTHETDVVFVIDNEHDLGPYVSKLGYWARRRHTLAECEAFPTADVRFSLLEVTDDELVVRQPLGTFKDFRYALQNMRSRPYDPGMKRIDMVPWRILRGQLDDALDRRPYARLVIVMVSARNPEPTDDTRLTAMSVQSLSEWRHARFLHLGLPSDDSSVWKEMSHVDQSWLHYDWETMEYVMCRLVRVVTDENHPWFWYRHEK